MTYLDKNYSLLGYYAAFTGN